MKFVQILALFLLFSIVAAGDDDEGSDDDSGCGGFKQGCCANSQCNYGFRCLNMGDRDWVGMAKRCRKPGDSIKPPQGQTTAQLSGWVMVKVLARGGKCFVKINGNIDTSVTTFGEGTFGETFGDLNALGECADGASGYGIGYIRADVMATAILGPDGECITTGTSEINSGTKVNGEGIIIGLAGDAGATVGCNKRKLLTLADFLN
ncbi:hypothetical protein BSKO_13571 [Bryopsis sp. KO-2023]|nr:hypothetical protein BSKO_13571 [Bryopsis sp. KO-2023]